MVAEDDAVLRKTIALGLRGRGFNVAQAETGDEALERFRGEDFDAVLLDAIIPRVDGFEVCRRLREKEKGRGIPILIITGLDDSAAVRRAYDAGATDFIPKPLRLGILRERLRGLIEASHLEERLRNKRLQFDAIFKSIPSAIIFSRLDQSILLVNPAFSRHFGYRSDEVINRKAGMLYDDDRVFREHEGSWQREINAGTTTTYKVAYRRADDSIFIGETTVILVTDDAGGMIGWLRIVEDITGRLERERAIAERTAELQAVTEHAPEMIARLDTRGRFLFVNRVVGDFFRRQPAEFEGCTGQELQLDAPWDTVWSEQCQLVRERRERQLKEVVVGEEDRQRVYQALFAPERHEDGAVTTVIAFIRDVTAQKQVERIRIQADRLDTLGVLAGGVAHDFNNIIGALISSLALIRESVKNSPAATYLDDCRGALDQARYLSRQLITFAQGGEEPIKAPLDVRRLVKEVGQFTIRNRLLRLKHHCEEDIWPGDADSGQIVQVLSNLFINAEQAMPNGGRIETRLSNCILGEDNNLTLPAGRYLKLEIVDNGPGIPPHILDRVFDPYFTTKREGSGLGLATTYAIMKRHGGLISVRSQIGEGATFVCYLPAAVPLAPPENEPEAPAAAEETLEDPVALPDESAPRVLLMEDQPIIRRGLARLLAPAGYKVIPTASGEEALKAFQEAEKQGRPINLVILDMAVVEGMGGLEVIQQLRLSYPQLPAIVTSGLWDDPVMREPERFGFNAALCKPYNKAEIIEVIARLQDREVEASGS
ncbi:MAG: response regulator [Verrucomicrobiota bacterium JB022]|nr:response regulator [Verrucomicrobiota bacterium JB022]